MAKGGKMQGGKMKDKGGKMPMPMKGGKCK